MILTYLIKVIFAFIIFQWQRVDTENQQVTETGFLCGCFNRTCILKNITCIDDGENRWMGLRYFGFGLMQNGTDCDSLDNSPLIPIPQNEQCILDFNAQHKILQTFSGFTIAGQENQKQYSIDYCKHPNAYFVANYDCITYNSARELVLDSLCSFNKTLTELSLSSSKRYPSFGMNSSGVRSCSCSLTVTSQGLLLRTYDNRLSNNQTLTLSYSNQTIIESWQVAKNITEVMNRKQIPGPFSSQPLLLKWKNNADIDGGKIWIVMEAINGNIHVSCQHNATAIPTAVPTSTFATHPATTMSAAIAKPKLTSIPVRSSAEPDTPYSLSSTQTLNIKETTEPSEGHGNIGVIIGGVFGGLIAFILLILCCLFLCKKKKNRTEPEKCTQPAKNTFKGSCITQGIPNEAIKGSKAHNEVDVEKARSFSITNSSLPSVPIAGSFNALQTKNDNPNKNDGYLGSPGERRENLTNDDDIGSLKTNRFAKLSDDGERMVNDDVAPLTKNTVDREIIIKEQQINTSDTSTDVQEKKMKEKKTWKKKNTIEALLGDDDTSTA